MEKDMIKQAFQLGYLAGSNRHRMEKSAGILSNLLWLLGGAGLATGGYLAYNKIPQFQNFVDKTWDTTKDYSQRVGNFVKDKWNQLVGPSKKP